MSHVHPSFLSYNHRRLFKLLCPTLEHAAHVPLRDRVVAESTSLRQHWSAVRDHGQNAFIVGPHVVTPLVFPVLSSIA